LLGPKYEQDIDPFRQQIYHQCHVLQERILGMQPMVVYVIKRPYFIVGLLVTRPNQELLRL